MIAPTSFFSDYGGHIRILEETRALQARGVEVAIVTYYKGNDVPGIDIRRTAPLPWHTDYEVGSSRHKLAFDAYLAVKAASEARRFRPDIIHGHMHEGALIGGALARLLGVPLVFDFQGSLTGEMVDHGFLNPRGALYPWVYRLESAITRRLPDAILTSSGRAAELLRDDFGVPPEHIHALPDCADADQFDPARFPFSPADHPLRTQYGIPREAVVVGYLGLLTDYQGVPHLIEAAARLKAAGEPIHFLVMGYPNVESYHMSAHAWGVEDRVTFTGRVPFTDAAYYLAAADIAVTAKMSTTEGSGKLLNYMAMAQPIVAYDTPVNREYLDELGVYAPAGDVAAFTEAIRALANDPSRQRALGRELRRRAQEKFSWATATAHILELYQLLTKEGV